MIRLCEFKNHSISITTMITTNASSSPTSMLVGLGFDVGVFYVSKNSTRISQHLKLPRNAMEGDFPRTTTQFQFFKTLIVVCGGVGRLK
jgi:hypothetical protein